VTSLHDHSHWVDRAAYLFAGVSGIFFALSFWQAVALGVAILSGLVSLILGGIRLHDRIRYGPTSKG